METKKLEIKGRVRYNEPLSKHTTFRIGGPARILVEAKDENELKKVMKYADMEGMDTVVLGRGSNVLVSDKGFNGVVIKLTSPDFQNVRFKGTTVFAGSGILLAHLIILTCKHSLGGLGGLVGIPGTVGGAVCANAGYKGNIGGLVKSVRVMDKQGRVKRISSSGLKFGYRTSNLLKYIILEVEFSLKKAAKKNLIKICEQLMRLRRKSQPWDKKSAGCIFRNPKGEMSTAGEIIDFCGLKGKRCGDAIIARKHANFIVNTDKATAKDVLDLAQLVQKTVKQKVGVDLKLEIMTI